MASRRPGMSGFVTMLCERTKTKVTTEKAESEPRTDDRWTMVQVEGPERQGHF
jgi:hypothetical protein